VLERREKISCSNCVRYEEVMYRDEEERSVLRTIKKARLNELVESCVGSVFGNRLLRERQKSIKEKTKKTYVGKQLLDDLKETRRRWKW